jgi:peptidoglycan/xylan/chitin deacetylase (PgdA/CDA1 family)
MKSSRSIAFKLLPALAQCIPLNGMIGITGRKLIFPFYHLVSDEDVPHVKHLYKVRTTREFNQDLDFLLRYYNPIGISDVLDFVNHGKTLPANSFLISFDDGLREFHDVAAPVLLRKGIPAVCFLNSGFIDNAGLFYRYKASLLIDRLQKGNEPGDKKIVPEDWFRRNDLAFTHNYHSLLSISYANRQLLDELAILLEVDFDKYLKEHRPYLDSSQVTSLIGHGFAFGSHSIDHPEYRFLTEEEQIRQTEESLSTITGRFGIKEKLFCFPFTDYGVKKSFFDKIFDPSKPIADLTFGGAGMKLDSIPKNLQRVPFEGTSLTAKQILATEYLYYMIKSIFGKNLIRR